jgi:hypothetical protein
MKRVFLIAATAVAVSFGATAGYACSGKAGVTASTTTLVPTASTDQSATDISSAKKKRKARSTRTGGGASKAGTGGGAGGEGGSGSVSEKQQGTPRGNPNVPTSR